MPAGMPKAYYEIMKNLKAKFEKTGKVGRKKYSYWDDGRPEGNAVNHAHNIAQRIIKDRQKKKVNSNKELLDDLNDYLKKTRETQSFNHPDYKHVHNNYDPDK